jgi:hypothetical protein
MEQIVTLQSNVINNHQNNTISCFTTQLSQRLKLEGSWVVGISEIQYKKSWYNVLESSEILLVDKNGKSFKRKKKTGENKSDGSFIYLSEGHYETEEQLVMSIDDELKKFRCTICPSITYNKVSKKINITPGEASESKKLYPFFEKQVQDMLGLENDLKLNENHNYFPVEAITISSESVSLEFRPIVNSSWTDPIRPVEITRGYHSLYIYSNIAYPSYIGDAYAQILRVVEVPSEKKFGDDIVIRYENPQYRKVLMNEINEIEINIKDDSGELIPFKYGRVRIDLHFKKL